MRARSRRGRCRPAETTDPALRGKMTITISLADAAG